MANSIVRAACEEAAPVLAGLPVRLFWEAPAPPHELGSFSKVLGQAVIRIDPEINAEAAYRVLLHECAHARRHFDRMLDVADTLAGKTTRPDPLRESEAEALAGTWDTWARRRARSNSVLMRLWELKRWT